MTDQQDPDPIDFQNLSIVAINHEILRRIAELKHFSAAELGLDDPPLSLLMLECMYELKMSSLRIRTEEEIRKFDSYSDRQLVKKAVKIVKRVFQTNYKSQNQHKNYYLLERENVERRYEQLARSIQRDVLEKLSYLSGQLRLQQRKEGKLCKYHKDYLETRSLVIQASPVVKQRKPRRSIYTCGRHLHLFIQTPSRETRFNSEFNWVRNRNKIVNETEV